jgi:hypothetical protein
LDLTGNSENLSNIRLQNHKERSFGRSSFLYFIARLNFHKTVEVLWNFRVCRKGKMKVEMEAEMKVDLETFHYNPIISKKPILEVNPK